MAQKVHRDAEGRVTLVEADTKVSADSEFAVQIPDGVTPENPLEAQESKDSDERSEQNEKDSKAQAKNAAENAKNQSRDRSAESRAANAPKPSSKPSEKDKS